MYKLQILHVQKNDMRRGKINNFHYLESLEKGEIFYRFKSLGDGILQCLHNDYTMLILLKHNRLNIFILILGRTKTAF